MRAMIMATTRDTIRALLVPAQARIVALSCLACAPLRAVGVKRIDRAFFSDLLRP